MPESAAGTVSVSAFGRQYNDDVGITSETGQPFSPTVPKAYAGTLTTRTDNTTGVVTLSDVAHTLITGDKVMVYWEVQTSPVATRGRRRYVPITVAGAAISISIGAGDNLPLATAVITLCRMEQINVAAIGADVQGILAQAGTAECNFVYESVAPAELLYIELPASQSYIWTSAMGITNPLAGVTVATVWVGHNDILNSQTIAGAILKN